MTLTILRLIRTLATCFPLMPTAVAAVVLGTAQHGAAQNMGFTPGDAFFVFALTEKVVNDLPEKGGTVTLCYETPLVGFGGYAGFDNLRIEGVPPQFVDNLRRVYRDHRKSMRKIVGVDILEDGTKRESEMNPPIAFVYNRDVDWSEQRIALKYNEDWPNLPPDAFAGPGRNMGLGGDVLYGRAEVYQPLVKSYYAVVEDWRNAKRFAPLKVRVPKNVAWGKAHEPLKEPVVAQSKDVQIVVTTEEDLEDYFLRKPDVQFYQVTAEGTDVCRWQAGDEGVKLVKEKLGKGVASQSTRTKRKSPMRYYGMVRENRKNGDITIPIWPDCRLPSGEQATAAAERSSSDKNAARE